MKKFKFIILAAAALAMFLIFTGCGSKGETEVMRAEHPNPKFKRDSFINLNGQWDFKFDSADYNMKINVPFCFESELSGIGDKTFHSECSYKRSFSLDDIEGKKVLLHIGACDYDTTVKINGTETGNHRGGYTPINLDITEAVKKGENEIVVDVKDDVASYMQASGKQTAQQDSYGCFYTRTTGIWQTVYMEVVPENYVKSVSYDTNSDGTVKVTTDLEGSANLRIDVSFEGKPVGSFEGEASGVVTSEIKLDETHLWDIGEGNLYDVKITFGEDVVNSYFGIRDIEFRDGIFYLNDKPVYQRLVLDQGYYEKGIYTAPTAEDLEKDIQLSLDAGFNGARLHQKVFEPLFLYYADKAGYIVWGEYPSWGAAYDNMDILDEFKSGWLESVQRDKDHPSIVCWCPFNETVESKNYNYTKIIQEAVYNATKELDSTRPVCDASGGTHYTTDIFDIHDYEQNPAVFAERYGDMKNNFYNDAPDRQEYKGQPINMSEYGGIKWAPDTEGGWGYGDGPATEEEFIARYKGLTEFLLDSTDFYGFCYTQLYDVEQEQNGLYNYDRTPKFDMSKIKEITSKKAATVK